MKQVIIIGTVHMGFTPVEELIVEVSTHRPDRVFVEVDEAGNGAKEMQGLYSWLVSGQVAYVCFDYLLTTNKYDNQPSQTAINQFTKDMRDKLGVYNWKELNKPEIWMNCGAERLNQDFVDKYYDTEKERKREERLVSNIEEQLIDGVNVVVTGAGHVDYFLENISNSSAPLRS